jgi:FAD/FMN-containing dehydrogenase
MSHRHLAPKVPLTQVIQDLKAMIGDKNVLTDEKDLKTWGTDWTKLFDPNPLCIAFPANTKEVSQLLAYCNQNELAVTPSGGRTGLCAGAVACNGEIILNMSRMSKIIDLDPVGMTVTVESGVTTEALQIAATEAGLFFALDLASKGSCQIGGNIATNAGGVKLIRYGGTREQVLGLEVVLADGSVLDMNTALRKNNSGYDLKQLFIGSEGTLGVVTKAVLRLTPRPRELQLAILAVESFPNILKVLEQCGLKRIPVTAFEFFTDVAHKIVISHQHSAKTPFATTSPFYVLLEIEKTGADGEIEQFLEHLFNNELITDATVANTSQQFKDFWALRENITESLTAYGHVRKNDIALAVDQLGQFVESLEIFRESIKDEALTLVLFGHIGDGNLHINYVASKTMPSSEFQEKARAIESQAFKLLSELKGSISAEHGIGLTKKQDLHFTRSDREVEFMRGIKKLWDPKGILNPSKIFDVSES